MGALTDMDSDIPYWLWGKRLGCLSRSPYLEGLVGNLGKTGRRAGIDDSSFHSSSIVALRGIGLDTCYDNWDRGVYG